METPTDIETLAKSVAALGDELKSVRRRLAELERRQEAGARRHARRRERPSGSRIHRDSTGRRQELLSRPRDAVSRREDKLEKRASDPLDDQHADILLPHYSYVWVNRIDDSAAARARRDRRIEETVINSLEPIPSIQRPQRPPAPIQQPIQQVVPGMAVQRSERVASTSDANVLRCSNCGGNDHTIVHCLNAPEGQLIGCIFCHTQDHNVDECSTFQDMSLGEQVSLLVHQRPRLPPLQTQVPWIDWLRDWLSSDESHDAHGNTAMPSGYPWSEDFTRNLSERNDGEDVDALQKEFDEGRDFGRLPTDPATANFGAVFAPRAT